MVAKRIEIAVLLHASHKKAEITKQIYGSIMTIHRVEKRSRERSENLPHDFQELVHYK